MFSIYTSLYNLSNGFIDWKDALDNFTSFAEEVVIATFLGDVGSSQLLEDYRKDNPKCKIVYSKLLGDELDFDGQLKNLALKFCTQPFCILLDGDERIDIKDKPQWENISRSLKTSNVDAVLLPVIDLFHSDKEYKSLSQKWYLHKNLPNLNRGIVNFAKKDNDKIDHTKSDTCELIYDNGELCKSISIFYPDYPKLSIIKFQNYPKIWHLGWLDKEKRLKSNTFWQPVWNNRAGEEVKNIIHSKEKLDKIEYFPHGLKLWYE